MFDGAELIFQIGYEFYGNLFEFMKYLLIREHRSTGTGPKSWYDTGLL